MMPNGFFALRRVTTAATYAGASGDVGTGGVISTAVPHTLILHNESTTDAEIIALSTSTDDADIFARLIPNTPLRTQVPSVMIPTIYAKALSGTPVLLIEAERTGPS